MRMPLKNNITVVYLQRRSLSQRSTVTINKTKMHMSNYDTSLLFRMV